MSIDLKALGFTQEELQQRVIDQICEQLMSAETGDDEGHTWIGASQMQKALETHITAQINASVKALADEHVLPHVHSIIEGIVLQKTNQWGEKNGQPVTFVEYLVQRADTYMREDVNHDGQSKEETNDSYNWRKHTTRMTHAINKHLQFEIKRAMGDALEKANESLNGALEGAARQAMIETAGKLSIKFELKR